MNSTALEAIAKYGRFIKFSHTLFALPFAGIAFVLAILEPPVPTLPAIGMKFFWILVCMVGARSAAMGFNRWADKRIDSKNPRTANREIPSGQISDTTAILFIIASSLVFFLGSWFLNRLSFYLSFPTLFLLLTYSYTKRFTFLCHFLFRTDHRPCTSGGLDRRSGGIFLDSGILDRRSRIQFGRFRYTLRSPGRGIRQKGRTTFRSCEIR